MKNIEYDPQKDTITFLTEIDDFKCKVAHSYLEIEIHKKCNYYHYVFIPLDELREILKAWDERQKT